MRDRTGGNLGDCGPVRCAVGVGKRLVSLDAPRIVNVLGIAPSDFCSNDEGRARVRVTRETGRVVRRNKDVVSINTFSAHPNTSRMSRRRRKEHLGFTLSVIHERRPSTTISMSACHPALTHGYVRR